LFLHWCKKASKIYQNKYRFFQSIKTEDELIPKFSIIRRREAYVGPKDRPHGNPAIENYSKAASGVR
jgi:hypothetical protein